MRSLRDRLRDSLCAANDLINFVNNIGADDFRAIPLADRMAHRAIKNALAELGEAVKALPPDLLARHPAVDWKGFARLRDVVAHGYFALDQAQLWPVINDDLPPLLVALQAELSNVAG